jgi:group II intron reverse transcriptase/maturase
METSAQVSPSPNFGLAGLGHKEHLYQSWRTVARRHGGPGPDGESVEAFGGALSENLHALSEELRSGSYQPRPAKRVWLAKAHGGERGVLVLCVRDRVAQGAVRRALNPVLKRSLHPASFAYREGLGALRAVRCIIGHRDAGRGWVARGDIASFFDGVSHERLLERLGGFVDAEVQSIVARIVGCPMRDGGSSNVLAIGLPQGGSLSPLLANFYLNPFDAAVSHADTGPVRFADDFAVACASPSRAGEVLELAGTALEGLLLKLNGAKTRIVSFDQGFDFLGFRFQGRGVRVAPARIQEFKAHMEHLLSPSFGSSSSGAVRQANDLIRGWRAYFQLGEVALDFETLDAWLADRFGAQAAALQSLVPRAKGRPALGGYDGRARRAPVKPKAHKHPRPTSAPMPDALEPVRCNAEGLPTQLYRKGAWLAVKDLPPLQLREEIWEGLAGSLERAALYHRATLASRWPTDAAQEAVLICAAALSGRKSAEQARAAYGQALAAMTPAGFDLRQPRGVLRRRLRLYLWQALLKAGLELGPEGGLPKLALLLAAAYEAPTVDFCALRALKSRSLNKPLGEFNRVLGFRVSHGSNGARSAKPWTAVLDAEAVLLAGSLTGGSAYTPWLFGERT